MNEDELFEGTSEAQVIEVLESGGRVCVLVNGQMYILCEALNYVRHVLP